MKSVPNPMFRDFSLLDFAEKYLSDSEHILFFYLWPQIAISLGYRQRQGSQLREESKAAGLAVSIRPSGGRAVIHGSDICFTFISSQSHKEFGGNLKESYSKVSNYVLDLINKYLNENLNLNLKITLSEDSRTSSEYTQELRKLNPSTNCFDYLVNGEGCIYHQSKKNKVFGSAQMMHKNFFIQQGSLLVNRLKNIPELSFRSDTLSLSDIIQSKEFDLNDFCDQLNSLSLKPMKGV